MPNTIVVVTLLVGTLLVGFSLVAKGTELGHREYRMGGAYGDASSMAGRQVGS